MIRVLLAEDMHLIRGALAALIELEPDMRVVGEVSTVAPELAAAAITGRPNPLTPREADVLRMAGDGADLAEIASALFLSKGTVRNYLGAIVTKLDARNRLDAVRIAVDHGWI